MIEQKINASRAFYLSGATRSVEFRRQSLQKLRRSLLDNKQLIFDAFAADFNKCEFDVCATELGLVLAEISHILRNLRRLSRPKHVRTDFINFPSRGYICPEPHGVVLIMSPWNYPLQLALSPLVGALAAGNTALVKPSDYSRNVSEAIERVLSVFPDEHVAVITGGRKENAELLEQRFDFIFFTGGSAVGRLVMEKASRYLTPVLLELGGKSPCIIAADADIELAARRIAWGKFLNCGQTCVAPDYVLAHRSVKARFLTRLTEYIRHYYYEGGELTKDFPLIINDRHAERVTGLINPDKVVFGGAANGRRIEPTVLDGVTRDDKVMSEEIFGPVLPILEFDDIQAVIDELQTLDKPLAFYYFGSPRNAKHVMDACSFGGGCVNDVIMHLSNSRLPFGGVGESGMGSYHGDKSFEVFSHYKSIFVKSRAEIKLKYPPYTEKKLRVIKRFLGIK